MYSHFQRLLRDQIKIEKSNEEMNKKMNKKINKEINEGLSPKTLRKNISNDNFMKFQWAWTL